MNAIQLRRFELGLTQGEVAKGAILSRPTIAAAERGEPISAPSARKLADFYGVSVAELLGLDEKSEATV